MSSTVRRVGGAAVAFALFAVAFAVTSRNRARAEDEAAQQAQAAAEASLATSRAGLDKLGTHLLDTAKTGSGLRSLEALVTSSVDAQTFQDFFSTEEAWAPYRKFDASALLIGDHSIASTGDAELMHDATQVADDARAAGNAMAWVSAKGRPARLAAVRMRPQTPNGGVAVVVVLGEWLTPAALAQAVDANAGVAVVAGDEPLVAGTEAQRQLVQQALGGGNAELRTAESTLGKGVKLLVAVDTGPLLARARDDARRFSVIGFLVDGVLSALVLAFFLWPRKPALDHELLRETTLQLKKSQEELQKVSLRLSQPGVAAFTPGDTISINSNPYITIKELGEGGMATVSVASREGQKGFKRLFVLKRLRPELLGSPEALAAFTDEANLGAKLVHSNIVPVIDVGKDTQGHFIVQEYIQGRNLDALSQASLRHFGKPIPVELVLLVAQETLRALEYAHNLKDDAGKPLHLVHRDISPNNLMISERGELKLLDFGIVKADNRLTETTPGIVKGNLFFMSPEQARGQPVDVRSDLYSLGMVLYVVSSGHTLYGGNTSYEVLSRAAHGLVAEDVALVRALGNPLAPLIERAMQYDPAARFQTASEFLAAVQATGRVGNASQLEALMRTLFAHELADEAAKLRGSPTA